jgi:hypothetical protein
VAGRLLTAWQISAAFQHRVRNRQPDGGFAGDGTSPSNTMRALDRSMRGSGTGTADRRAFVYGCAGCSYTVSAGPTSTIFPRYITATTSLMWRTTDRSCAMNT